MLRIISLYLVVLSVVACGPINPVKDEAELNAKTAKLQVVDNIDKNMSHAADAADFWDIVNLFDSLKTSKNGCEPNHGGNDPMCDLINENANGQTPEQVAFIELFRDDFVEFMELYIFLDIQVESDENNVVVYKLDPKTICGNDADCQNLFQKYPVRFKMTSSKQGDVDVVVQMGPKKLVPATFEIHKTKLTATVDLDVFKTVSDDITAIDAHIAKEIPLPKVSMGKVRFSITQDAIKTASVKLEILKAVSFAFIEDGTTFAAGGAKSGSVTVTSNAVAKQLSAHINLVGVTAKTDYQQIVNETAGEECFMWFDGEMECHAVAVPAVFGNLSINLPALTADIVLDSAQKILDVNGFGLGNSTATLKHDQNTAVGVDLNAQDGRTIDFTLSTNKKGRLQLDVSPLLDIQVMTKLGAIAEMFDGDLPELLKNDVLTLLFTNAKMPSLTFISEGLKVVSGTILFLSKEAPHSGIKASDGECVVESDNDAGPNAHPLIDMFETGLCPAN